MKEEEQEALKIQKQRLEAMDEADFMDDTLPGWGKGAEKDATADKALLEDFSKELKNISFEYVKICMIHPALFREANFKTVYPSQSRSDGLECLLPRNLKYFRTNHRNFWTC